MIKSINNRILYFFCWGLSILAFYHMSAQDQPNIIFIMADDLGYGDVGLYGQQRIKTPNIDRLGSGGIKFTDYYSGAAVCAPARSVLMSGLHTGHTRVRGNFGKGCLLYTSPSPRD